MSEWNDRFEDKELEDIFSWENSFEDVPVELKERIMKNVSDKKNEILQKPRKTKNIQSLKKILLVALSGFAFLMVVAIVIILLNTGKSTFPCVLLTKGENYIVRKNKTDKLIAGYEIKDGDKILCSPNSEATIQLPGEYYININENTTLRLSEVKFNNILVYLDSGSCIVMGKSNKRLSFLKLNTSHVRIEPVGTQFFVESGREKTIIAVNEGEVKAYGKGNYAKGYINLKKGEMITISPFDTDIKTTLSSTYISLFKQYSGLDLFMDRKKISWLTLQSEYDALTISINEKNFSFNRELSISLVPGLYNLVIKKDGYITYSEKIELIPGEHKKKNIYLVPDEIIEKDDKPVWEIEKIYSYKNRDNPDSNSILGIFISGEFALAETRTELIGINKRGEIQWKNLYGTGKRIVFYSPVLIYKSTFLTSANYKLIRGNIITGDHTILDVPGILPPGYGITWYDNLLYMPFSEGIYTFEPEKESLDFEPLIKVVSPITPIISNNKLYVTSLLSPFIKSFTLNGNPIAANTLENTSACIPAIEESFIYCGDNAGWLYKFSEDLLLENKIKLNAGINSIMIGENNLLFIFTSTGMLSTVKKDDLSLLSTIVVDSFEKTGNDYYKYPVIINHDIYIGNDKGKVLIISTEDFSIKDEITISNAEITCPVAALGSYFFTGTSTGEIIRMQKVYKKGNINEK